MSYARGEPAGEPVEDNRPTMVVPGLEVPRDIVADLARSGLKASDMRIRRLDSAERAAVGASESARGYVLPYFSFRGDILPFYRVKILNPETEYGIKYRQPRTTANHIYFPPGLHDCLLQWLRENSTCPIIVITEGEKKAACAVKYGIPCVGLGGVDSWRSRTLVLPKDIELTAGKKDIRAKLPARDLSLPELSQLAEGFGDLIDAVAQFNLTPVIIFDSDKGGTVKADVQRAATMLAYEMRYLGIPSNRIRQILLPSVGPKPEDPNYDFSDEPVKTGLDDFLIKDSGQAGILKRLITEAFNDPSKFPKHPNPKGFIAVQLNKHLERRDCQQVSSVLLSELDAQGVRFRETNTHAPYYYDKVTYKLIPAAIVNRQGKVMHETPFGVMLYQRFGLTANDSRVLTWLASQFTGEEPINDVTPRRIKTLITETDDPSNPHGIAIQVSDSRYFSISPDSDNPLQLRTNGDLGILFEQDQVEPLDVDRVMEYFEEFNRSPKIQPWWAEVLEDTNIGKIASKGIVADISLSGVIEREVNESAETGEGIMTPEGAGMRRLACLLFYISPFLDRWRGVQLPVELMLGEAGSGKSSVYNMRLRIMTGRPSLRNLPTDVRDWNASITNSGGLHVTDNVHFSRRDVKQVLSDEICRLITEPHPSVEMRKLYTTADQVRLPVNVTFAFTAVEQPFQNSDLFSRAAVFQTCSLGKAPDGDWVARKLEDYGGREAWMAHHLVFLHRFLKRAAQEQGGWDPSFHTAHRLAHYEQCLSIAASLLDLPDTVEVQAKQITESIQTNQTKALVDSDWTLQIVQQFISMRRKQEPTGKFTAKEIVEWATTQEDFGDNPIIQSNRKLGRYLSSHYSMISKVCYITPGPIVGNVQTYRYLRIISDEKSH